MLLELLLRYAFDAAFAVEEDGAGAGGALVEGEDVGHGGLFRVNRLGAILTSFEVARRPGAQ